MSTERETAAEPKDARRRAADQMRRVYTDAVVDHALNPRNARHPQDARHPPDARHPGAADGYASATTADGDTMRIWLQVTHDRIVSATFWSDACAPAIASLSMITELARGRTVVEALRIGQQDVLDALGGLPGGNVHCARQAAHTLRKAIRDYLAVKKSPWKKTYRRS